MRIVLLIIITFFLTSFNLTKTPLQKVHTVEMPITSEHNKPDVEQHYEETRLENVPTFEPIEQTLSGMEQINPHKKDIITIIDFTPPSTEKRMVVLNLDSK